MASTVTSQRVLDLIGFQNQFVPLGIQECQDYLFLLASGGRGSGKTLGGAFRMISYICKHPNSYGIITAPIYDNFVANTFPPIQKAFDLAGFQEGRDWDYIKNEKRLMFYPTNAVAFVRTTEEPQKLAGPDLSWFWMDEARESPREAFAKLIGCLRRDGFPRQAWITSTPAGRVHWFFEFWWPEEFYLENPDVTRQDTIRIGTFVSFQGKTKENPFNGNLDGLLQTVYGTDSPMYRQEAEGELVHLEDMVFDNWDRSKHMVAPDLWPGKPKLILAGVDFGFDAPTAFLIGGVDDDKRVYLLDEFYKRKLSNTEIGDAAVSAYKKHNIRFFICDSASPEKIRAINDALRLAHIGTSRCLAIPAHKKVGSLDDLTTGIGLCYSIMSNNKDGHQQLYVDPRLINFRREIENWTREKPKYGYPTKATEKPRVSPDHLADSFRYLMNFLARRGYIGIIKPQRATYTQIKIGDRTV